MKPKVKFVQLFNPAKIQGMNPDLETLISFPTKRAALRYDLNIKLNKAVVKAIGEFEELRKKLCEEHSRAKEVEFRNGKKTDTMMKIITAPEATKEDKLIAKIDGVDVAGNMVIERAYDIIDLDEFNKVFAELLETQIELDCYSIKLSKLEAEDCSSLNFASLADYIEDDRVEK